MKLNYEELEGLNVTPLDFEVIERAFYGDPKAMLEIIEHYQPHIIKLATETTVDDSGKEQYFVNESKLCQLENQLIKGVLGFRSDDCD